MELQDQLQKLHGKAWTTENAIGVVKDAMTGIALQKPGWGMKELLAAAVLAHNERVRDFSPAQWALRRSPRWDSAFFDSWSRN